MPYLAPTTREDALRFIDSRNPKIVAGCTDYYPSLGQGERHQDVLDITRIEGLRGVTASPEGWRIGAATTWTDIVKTKLPPGFDGLKVAALEVGSLQIQNQGTIAGNLCNASPAADGVPPLLTLDARVELGSSKGTRTVPLPDFITGVRQVDLVPGEMVVAVHIPALPESCTSAFLKLGARKYMVISIAMVAVVLRLDAGRVADLSIAVGSCSPVAQRLAVLEQRLIGRTVGDIAAFNFADGLQGLSPISDVRGSADYRVDVVAEMCRRAVLDACTKGLS